MLGRQRPDPVEREHRLGVERMLDPERAVLVEGGDPVGRQHEVGAARRGHGVDERDDRRFRGTVVPGRQRIVGRLDVPGRDAKGEDNEAGEPGDPLRNHGQSPSMFETAGAPLPERPLSPSTREAQLPVGRGISKPSFASASRTNWKRSYWEIVIGPV